MKVFFYERVTTTSKLIRVVAENEQHAEVKASVGGLAYVREKEGVEVFEGQETTTTNKLVGPLTDEAAEVWEEFLGVNRN